MMGIEFLGRHSHKDFGLSMAPGKSIGLPEKQKILVPVPFSNVEYDFSKLYGSQTYTSRELVYSFNILDQYNYAKENMNVIKTKVMNWLMNSNGKQKLYDDAYPGYYFLAEVEGGSSFEENYADGVLTVTFNAYPFMISELPEGNDIWDTFNFELDVAQRTNFEINGSKDILLINPGVPDVYPVIETSNDMQLTVRGTTYSISTGINEQHQFALVSGENEIVIEGQGNISFNFYKELI